MRNSYLDYAMAVIVSRALPDVRDGLKPSQRRILVAMNDLNLAPGAQHRKCAKIAGDAIGNYHPHGEQVDLPDARAHGAGLQPALPARRRAGQLRLGRRRSARGDALHRGAPDARRRSSSSTTSRRRPSTFVPNYDEHARGAGRPAAARSRTCSSTAAPGIAVGMATNIPPHNLSEVCDAIDRASSTTPRSTIEELMQHRAGPGLPDRRRSSTGAQGIRDAYMTGPRAHHHARARATSRRRRPARESIVVTEIPYQVNKAALIEKIADLVRDGNDRGHPRPARRVRPRRDAHRHRAQERRPIRSVVLNQLYKHTQLQATFGVIMLALVDNRPQRAHAQARCSTSTSRTARSSCAGAREFDLDKAEKRAHILEGLKIALDHIDEVIALIREVSGRRGGARGR